MTEGTKLLDVNGAASMATLLMMSHHAFRRDLVRFRRALGAVASGEVSRVPALQDEWRYYRSALHGHHTIEDTSIFPEIRARAPAIAPRLERLGADHRAIDPVLERGDAAFAALPRAAAAVAVVDELLILLEEHLAMEEVDIVPFLREVKDFPAPGSEDEASLYAQGFAWSSHGVAPEVLARVDAMLPDNLSSKLPAARTAFAARCERAWGSADAGASLTSVPEG